MMTRRLWDGRCCAVLVNIGRVYDQPVTKEGARLLVDRLWPRGLRRDDPRVGVWHPQVAPSAELRRWYGHRPELYPQFAARYEQELSSPAVAAALSEILDIHGPVTLVTASRDIEHSHLPVLARLLRG